MNLEDSHHFRNSTVDTCCQLTDIPLPKIYEDKVDFVIYKNDSKKYLIMIQ